MGKHKANEGLEDRESKHLLKADSSDFVQIANIKVATHEDMSSILQGIHAQTARRPDWTPEELPTYAMPTCSDDADYNFKSGSSRRIDGLRAERAQQPEWFPKDKWDFVVANIAMLIVKIGKQKWAKDDELTAVMKLYEYHRWDLSPAPVVEPSAGSIINITVTDPITRLPGWYQKSVKDLKARFLFMVGNMPFSEPHHKNKINNHWVAGLLDIHRRTLYVIDGKTEFRHERALLFLERARAYWQRLGATEEAVSPARVYLIKAPPQRDNWSCGYRTLDWMARLMYNPRTILEEDRYSVNNVEQLWIQLYAQHLGIDQHLLRLPGYSHHATTHELVNVTKGPAVDVTARSTAMVYGSRLRDIRTQGEEKPLPKDFKYPFEKVADANHQKALREREEREKRQASPAIPVRTRRGAIQTTLVEPVAYANEEERTRKTVEAIAKQFNFKPSRHPPSNLRDPSLGHWSTPYTWRHDTDQDIALRPLPYHVQGWPGWSEMKKKIADVESAGRRQSWAAQ
ncbi:hypothetical protein G7054_g14523 [Neopestalotiopsis clavispora]|nr:hypothetical protein G7054_g14523 [Neopestalotiopsis clavispora]